MPRFFWFRPIERSGDDGAPQTFDLFRDPSEAGGSGCFFQHLLRQSRSDPPSAAPDLRATLVSSAAAVPSADPLALPGDLLDAASISLAFAAAGETSLQRDSVATPEPGELIDGEAERIVTVRFGTGEPIGSNGNPMPPFQGHGAADYVVAYSDRLDGSGQDSFVWDARSKTLLTGGAGDWPALGAGTDDTLELSGDFSAGVALPDQPSGLDMIVMHAGNDYNLVANDNNVDFGATLVINAMPLGTANHVMFDGSAETDGSFDFFGSESDDFFFGGAGGDRIRGLGGADTLSGGGGSDIFIYTQAGESSGPDYDTIADFDPATDRIDLPGGVAGFADAIEGGTLSTATFNDDLAAALADLEAAQAVWFAPDSGDLAGQIFLIVDGNDQPGYQPGEDFVFAIGGAPLADLTGHTDIFI